MKCDRPEALIFSCRECGSPIGVRCKNYLGKNKQTCPGRDKPPEEKPRGDGAAAPTLFDGLEAEQ